MLGTSVALDVLFFFFSSRRRHTRCLSHWSSDVCSSDLLPWLPVRMAVHTSEAQLRGAGRYVSGTIPEGERLRAFGHGGQILVSESTAATSGVDLPDRSTFVDVGMASLRTLGPPERVWQVVHPDLRSEFPPLRSLAPHALPVP